MTRIERKFAEMGASGRKAFIAYIMSGDPNRFASLELMRGLPAAGADIIELGIPFTDPMADGPTIQLAGQRALAAGQTLDGTLDLVREFRTEDSSTPIVLMGYYNPIHSRGPANFIRDAVEAGADGLIIVDLPPEEDSELCIPARESGLNFIRLATPTTDSARLESVLRNADGFVYYVSITGITGAAEADPRMVAPDVERIKRSTELPVCVGFGIKSAQAARDIALISDGAVVGSSIVKLVEQGKPLGEILEFVSELSAGAHEA